jgi:hypothetical protein
MARSIADIHARIDDVVRKQRGQYLSPAQIDRALTDAQIQTYQDYWAAYIGTNKLDEALDRFKTTGWFASNSAGKVTYPATLGHLLELYVVQGSTLYTVREVTEEELPDALKSQLRRVSATKPIGRPDGGGYQLYPQQVHLGTIIYLRLPVAPAYGYSQVGRVITYNPNTSTQIDFDEVYVDKIISIALTYFGISMNETEIIQFGEMKNKETTT